MLTGLTKGGDPSFLADIICEQPLISEVMTVLFNSAYFKVCLGLSKLHFHVCLFIVILMLWQS